MLPHRCALLLCALALILTPLLSLPAAAGAASLQTRVANAVRASGLAGSSSVVVYRARDQLLLYQHRPGRSVVPASNQKLYTGAAVLNGLGPNYRFQTRLALRGEQKGSTFTGTVYLIGGGDPTLSTGGFGRRNFGTAANLGHLTRPLRSRGIRKVRGKLVVDETFLDTQRYVSSWPWRFRYDETTALGALTVNHNYLGRWLGGRSAREPAVRAGQVYLQLLKQHDIRVTGGLRVGRTPGSAEEVGSVLSPPVRTIVGFMNRYSDNFTAEILIKDLGRIKRGRGSTASGAMAVRQQLKALGVATRGVRVADGSGLSSSNRTTARNLAELLNAVDRNANLRGPWLDSLAISGRTGTLAHRMRKRPYRGRVRAKTGTLRSASALSGYSTRAGKGERYGFAVVTNTGWSQVPYTSARRLQDNIASILVR